MARKPTTAHWYTELDDRRGSGPYIWVERGATNYDLAIVGQRDTLLTITIIGDQIYAAHVPAGGNRG